MNLPKVEYNIGQSFLMTLHLTPELQLKYGKKSLIVDAIYLGTRTNEDILSDSIKIIAMTQGIGFHHVVEFNDDIWVNDLCGFHGSVEKWNPTTINVETELKMPIISKDVSVDLSSSKDNSSDNLPDGPRPKTRHILHGSKLWNVDGIKAARIKGDGPIEVCSITGDELYYIEGDTGHRATFMTNFICTGCERLVGERAMQLNGSDKAKYPIIYVGAYCIECWPSKKS